MREEGVFGKAQARVGDRPSKTTGFHRHGFGKSGDRILLVFLLVSQTPTLTTRQPWTRKSVAGI